ncbi:Serine incorporator 2, partial [Lamellibrachia satsuma]
LFQIPVLCEGIPVVQDKGLIKCESIVGYLAVYRVCFALAAFFFFFMVLMIKVQSSKDPRSKIQNGFWFFKMLFVIGIAVGAFYIPRGSFGQTYSIVAAWMVIGMIGAFLFILIQLVLIVDFAHGWNERWLSNYEDTQSKAWFAGLLFFTIAFYIISLILVVLFYVFYTTGANGCALHKFFISFNLILCVIMSVMSVLPQIQEGRKSSLSYCQSCLSCH